MLDGERGAGAVFTAGGSGTWRLCGERGECFPPFPSEQEHLCPKPRKRQGSARRSSLSQPRGRPTVKIPGKGFFGGGGFLPVPRGLGMDNTGLQEDVRWVPYQKYRYRDAHPKQGEGALQTAASSPAVAPDAAFACRRGKTERRLLSCVIFVLEMEDKASELIL